MLPERFDAEDRERTMSLATYTLKMAAVTAPAAALLAFSGEPFPAGWLGGIVGPRATIGKAAFVVGMWVIGAAATAGAAVGFGWLSWALWRERRSRSVAHQAG
jgi:hypothetical protein